MVKRQSDDAASPNRDDVIDFDDRLDDSFIFADDEQSVTREAAASLHPHTELVDGFLQVFVGKKQITFDDANHVNPRLDASGEIIWELSNIGSAALEDGWERIAITDLVSFAKQMSEAGIPTCKSSDGFCFTIPITEDRSQDVLVNESRTDHDGDKIIQVLTRCGSPSHVNFDDLLRRNMQLPYGAFAIARVGSEDCVVVVDTWLPESVQSIELRKAVFVLAHVGDELEAQLHTEDRF